MDRIESIMSILGYVLNTGQRRHITGGILLSVSMLFGGLALTVMTMKKEDNNEQNNF